MNIIKQYFVEFGTLYIDIAPYMLLGMFLVGLLHIFFSKEFVIKHIGSETISSIVKASILGVPLPLCSCGVIPTAVYMAKNGASKGAVVSFLVSTPQTGIDSIIATYGMLGWVFAIYRPIIAFVNGIIAGIVINIFGNKEKLKLSEVKHHYHNDSKSSCGCSSSDCSTNIESKQENIFIVKIKKMYNYAFIEFLDDITNHFIVGLLISAVIGVAIPDNFFVENNLGSGIGGMILMALVGIPMYICATSSIPVAVVLMMKGVSPGAAFVFLTAGPVTNAASIAILLKVLGSKIVSIYLGITIVLAIISGLFLDFILSFFKMDILPEMTQMNHEHKSIFLLSLISLFTIFLILSIWRKNFKKYFTKKTNKVAQIDKSDVIELSIEGMSCNHCVSNIKNALKSNNNITSVEINLSTKSAIIKGNDILVEDIIKIIEDVGYKAFKVN